MPRRRLGVVLPVPAPTAREVDALRRACGDGALGRVEPHLTLVPPVNVREEDVNPGLAVLRDAAAGTPPLTLELGPPASFHPDTPVLYLAVGGDDLARLHDLRRGVFVEPFDRPLTWPFVPHVTLAEDLAPERLEAGVRALADFTVTACFDRLHLLEEQRDADGRRVWVPVAEAFLGARRVAGRGGLEVVLDVGADEFGVSAFASEARPPDLAPRDELVVTARREGTVVGVIRGWTGEAASIATVLVAPADRRLGIGTKLVRAFESEAASRGAAEVIVDLPEQPPSIEFWTGLGYATAAPEKHLRRHL